MLVLLALHAVVGFAILLGARALGRIAFGLAAAPMLAVLVRVALDWSGVVGDGTPVTEEVSWVPGLDLLADVRMDAFSILMVLLVAGMGVVVMAFSASYFSPGPASARTAGLLVLFGGSMLGLVLADNLGWLYVCWELTSITSYLLIGATQERAEQRTAALQALLITGAGGLAMLGGFVVIADAAGTWSLAEILADPPTGATVGAGLALVLAGALTKSAQYPFHFWLPGAMVAPTPVSAYLHSATMVKAGIYLVARFSPAFAEVGIWRPAVLSIGLFTMIAGGLRALRQHDLKLLLAFGTVSQLGFLLVLAGAGLPAATKAVCVLLLAHALFKGALFLVVGMVDHETGTRDLRELPALRRGWSAVRVVAVLSAASMAGLPPILGFVAKESAYEAFIDGGPADTATFLGLVAGSILTFAYSMRFVRPFLWPAGDDAAHAPSRTFAAPAVALAAGTVFAGVAVTPLLQTFVRAAANALDPTVGAKDVKLWHGVNAALIASLVTISLGIALVVVRERLEQVQERFAPPLNGARAFGLMLRGLNASARRITGLVQAGSLPVYIAVILVAVVGLPNYVLLTEGAWPGWPDVADSPAHPALAVLVAVAAIATAVVRRRFAAVLLLGAVGYSIALIFAIQGAADLALTQFAVETLSVVMFVLVIRHLPKRFRATPVRGSVPVRVAVAVAVGAGVFSLAIMTGAGTTDRAVSEEIVARAEPEGGGKNVVNVVLVDVRGMDTLGEITVLAVAAVGVVALARIGRGNEDDEHPADDDRETAGAGA